MINNIFVARTAAIAVLSGALVFSSAANAATLTVLGDKVFVSKGAGYAQVHGQTELGPTDCVLVNPGGSAQIAHDDGSVTNIDPGMSLCVGDLAAGGNGGGAGGAAAAAAAPGGIGATALVVGGLAVAGGVGLIASVSSNSDSAPASP